VYGIQIIAIGRMKILDFAMLQDLESRRGRGALSLTCAVRKEREMRLPLVIGVALAGLLTSGTIPAQAQTADLRVDKFDLPDPAKANKPLLYAILVTNFGPDTATDVVLTDMLPLNATHVLSSQGTCTGNGTAVVTCNLRRIRRNRVAIVLIAVQPTAAGMLSNTATVSSATTDPNPANNSDTETTTVN
jgi:uncharacterized repeat protein (TIGR01451 family)